MKRPVLLGFLVTLLATAAVAYASYVRPRMLVLHQVRNHALCQGVDAWIQSERGRTGSFPSALPPAKSVDAWGHPLSYQKLSDGFLLVSFGRDGKPDGSNYLALRALGDHPAGWNICGAYDADEVLSDKGWQRLCGK